MQRECALYDAIFIISPRLPISADVQVCACVSAPVRLQETEIKPRTTNAGLLT